LSVSRQAERSRKQHPLRGASKSFTGWSNVMVQKQNYRALVCCAVFFFIVLAGSPAQSAEVFKHPLSPETLPRYSALCAELASRPIVKGSFEQVKTIKRLNRSLTSKGTFLIAAELGMVWDTRTPFPSTIAMSRDFIIQSVPGGAKSKLDAKGNETFLSVADTLSAVFTGNVQRLRDKFDNYFTETTANSGAVWTLGLLPREKTLRSFMERIILNGEAGAPGKPAFVRSIVIHDANGDTVTYTLRDHRFPAALEADDKAFFFL
jgi:outer membrane lipoprotein-sorting protein